MSSQTKHDRARRGVLCLAASVLITGPILVPGIAWADDDGVVPDPRATSTVGDLPAPDETDDPTPAPGGTPTPDPSPSAPSTPAPTPTPAPSPPVAPPPVVEPPAPPVDSPAPAPAPAVPPSGSSSDGSGVRLPAGVAVRLSSLLRFERQDQDAVPAAPDDVHVDGGPDVGGTVELNATVEPDAPTGSVDAVQVRALTAERPTTLNEPVVWAPWAGALGVAAGAAALFILRGGRQIGR
ncbi:hypothetical protein [Microbacterium radiodurans]|uniref:Uncharacterized protein n=1 Tax=Microbacterium radiodurans TaxID=661398 RepID=A0A5J5ITJ3_9MICO|nr:hypothetical protein [Microbacterium radiodurans]KAA9086953.1 hypothetical protein F6B42_08200 [Microbacterium radiodurans]